MRRASATGTSAGIPESLNDASIAAQQSSDLPNIVGAAGGALGVILGSGGGGKLPIFGDPRAARL
jgi:hypothetical protein